jgi:hypothetical protein
LLFAKRPSLHAARTSTVEAGFYPFHPQQIGGCERPPCRIAVNALPLDIDRYQLVQGLNAYEIP